MQKQKAKYSLGTLGGMWVCGMNEKNGEKFEKNYFFVLISLYIISSHLYIYNRPYFFQIFFYFFYFFYTYQ